MVIEKYRLTLTHEMIVDGKTVKIDEPKVMELNNCDMNNTYVMGYKIHLLDELFYRFRKQLKGET